MRPEWQGLLRAPLSGETLRFVGSSPGNGAAGWGCGHLVTPRGHSVAQVQDGIVDFVQTPTWATLDMTKVTEDHWIEGGWNSQRGLGHERPFQAVVSGILSSGPRVVELGAGPGGGHMPMILERQPDATVLVNDLEVRMLSEWKRFLASNGHGQGVSFACFDACTIPLASSSVDCVSSHGCFSNIKVHRDLAVKEAFRILKQHGLLAMVEAHIVRPRFETLRDMLIGSPLGDPWTVLPGLITGWRPLVESVGFTDMEEAALSRQDVSPEDGDLGRLALKHGVTIEREWRIIFARK